MTLTSLVNGNASVFINPPIYIRDDWETIEIALSDGVSTTNYCFGLHVINEYPYLDTTPTKD